MISIFNATRALLCAALLAVGLSACSDTHKEYTTRTLTISLKADASEFSRVNITGNKAEGFATSWQTGDQIGVCIDAVGAEALRNMPLTAASVDAEGVASFSGAVTSSWAGSGTLYAYYPYKEGAGTSDATQTYGEIPAEQTMTPEGSFDTAAAYMVGQPIAVESSDATTLDVTTKFRQLGCFVNLSCKAIDIEGVNEGDIVEAVRLRVTEKCLAGEFMLNLATGEYAFSKPVDGVSVAVPSGMTLGNLSAWIVVNPFELTATDQMIVEIETADYIICKYISGRNINFGMRQVVTLNMGVDKNCEITRKVRTPRTVTYTIGQSTSGDLPANATFQYQGDSYGAVSTSKGATFSLNGWSNYTITGISINVSTAKSSNILISQIIVNGEPKTIYISKCSSTPSLKSLLEEPLPADTDSFQVALSAYSGSWTVESCTITYE